MGGWELRSNASSVTQPHQLPERHPTALTEDLAGPTEDDIGFLLPRPSPKGIAEFKDFYYAKFNRQLSEAEASEALAHLITIVYHCSLIEAPCSNTDSMPANPTTTSE